GALDLQHLLGDVDLLGLRRLVGGGGVLLATEALPGVVGELQAAVERVVGVDVPVPGGLAHRDAVPDRVGRTGPGGHGDTTGREGGDGQGPTGEAQTGAAPGGGLIGEVGGVQHVLNTLSVDTGRGPVLVREGR